MIVQIHEGNRYEPNNTPLRIRCPRCRHMGTFEVFKPLETSPSPGTQQFDINAKPSGHVLGQRRCPNPDCHAHVFFVTLRDELLVTYPAVTIDFDSSNLPDPVLKSLEEAIRCHSNQCYVAAAIMVRKTLEEVCRDQGAEGGNLKKRIEKLRDSVVLPMALLDGLDDVRFLGNDAAHVDAHTWNNVGKEEVEVVIDFTKEVLKGIYQLEDLLKRMRVLQSTEAAEGKP